MTPKRVLVVHPDAAEAGRLDAFLTRTGYFQVTCVTDGFAAADELHGATWDAFLLHAATPGLGPVGVLRRLRARESTARLPVVVLLSVPDPPTARLLLRAGARRVQAEPLTSGEVATALRRVCGIPDPAGRRARRSGPRPARKASPGPAPARMASPGPAPAGRAEEGGAEKPPSRPRPQVGRRLSSVIWRTVRRGEGLPELPDEVLALYPRLASVRGELVTKDLVALDVALSATVLRMANSVTYGGSVAIGGLAAALQRVGQRELAAHLRDTRATRARTSAETQAFIRRAFQEHSLQVGCVAEEVARHLGHPHPDAVFSAGLLHDVGKLFLVHRFPDVYREVERLVAGSPPGARRPDERVRIERALLGLDHGVIGYELSRAWRLSPAIQGGMLHHHPADERGRRLSRPRTTEIVALADLVAHVLEAVRPAVATVVGAGRGSELSGAVQAVPEEHEEPVRAGIPGSFDEAFSAVAPVWTQPFLLGRPAILHHVVEISARRVARALDAARAL
ncbi:MAG: HDOD domain-containing protein [Candidatus Eisenbacteria sp.]|nr:HDOD domain-containing protein [Candidatus Eisenbacteria bacterium]